jgi:hypothetical protein
MGPATTMDPEASLYDVLGVREEADLLEIQQAYNRKVEKVRHQTSLHMQPFRRQYKLGSGFVARTTLLAQIHPIGFVVFEAVCRVLLDTAPGVTILPVFSVIRLPTSCNSGLRKASIRRPNFPT